MHQLSTSPSARSDAASAPPSSKAFLRSFIIGLTAFLTVVDLFATQAILPSLAKHYNVTPAAMGFAVNASTLGMAVAGLMVGLFSQKIDRRTGILASLALLSVPTALLAIAPNLLVFTMLRVLQGLCMASAFTLTLAYLGERCSPMDSNGAFAAYITGNVASNLFGRLISAAVADHAGIASNFYFFALLNLVGAALVYITIQRAQPVPRALMTQSVWEASAAHRRRPALRSAFGIGFCVLFAFIGTFTYVNFILVQPPLLLSRMQLGFAYFVFLPSIVTTLLAGAAMQRFGSRLAIWGALTVAGLGLLLLLSAHLAVVLAGMVMVGAGTFFAQAVATAFVGRTAVENTGVASGFYLASYFSGGLIGSAILGQLFDRFGWTACVTGIAAALLVASLLALRLKQ